MNIIKKVLGEPDSIVIGKEMCKETRNASGRVDSKSKLTAFLYLLMRDELTCGKVVALVKMTEEGEKFEFTNGWLAKYAAHLALKLTKE